MAELAAPEETSPSKSGAESFKGDQPPRVNGYQILRALPFPVMVVDGDGVVEYVNGAAEQFFGHGSTALSGMRPVYLAAAVEMVGKRESTSLGLIYAVMDGIGATGGLLAGLAGTNDLRLALVFAASAATVSGLLAIVHPFTVRARPVALAPETA